MRQRYHIYPFFRTDFFNCLSNQGKILVKNVKKETELQGVA